MSKEQHKSGSHRCNCSWSDCTRIIAWFDQVTGSTDQYARHKPPFKQNLLMDGDPNDSAARIQQYNIFLGLLDEPFQSTCYKKCYIARHNFPPSILLLFDSHRGLRGKLVSKNYVELNVPIQAHRRLYQVPINSMFMFIPSYPHEMIIAELYQLQAAFNPQVI
jgi:hypothetical protein